MFKVELSRGKINITTLSTAYSADFTNQDNINWFTLLQTFTYKYIKAVVGGDIF